MQRFLDDLGRELVLVAPPQRIVSLVPSDTHTLVALGAGTRVVGRTRYCEDALDAAIVGGTKDIDVAAVLALAPDFVIANQEENSRRALEQLAETRVPVLVSLPRTVDAAIAHIARLARMIGAEEASKPLLRRALALPAPAPTRLRAFVPIWMDPLMTFNADTYGSDVLARLGVANVFGDRERRYPLAADLGKVAADDPEGRDLRYPRVTLDEVRARGVDAILLPDEPHAFSDADAAILASAVPTARIIRIPGKHLFWYGAWTVDGLAALAALLAD